MSERLGNGNVDVELGNGRFTLRWPEARVAVGPCRAAAVVDGSERALDGAAQAWSVEPGDGYGRAGTWARWRSGPGRGGGSGGGSGIGWELALHVPDEGAVVVVELELVPEAATTVDRLTPLLARTDLAYEHRLVDGYDSWAYSGVRSAAPGASFWNTAYVGRDDRALVVQALGAQHLCTRITNDGPVLRVDCGSAPTLTKAPGTWGYLAGDQPPLRLPVDAGATLRSEPVALAAGLVALDVVEELAGLAARTMRARRWTGPAPDGWESWYEYGLFVSSDDVVANARALRERYRDRPSLDLVQIDDGWQRTYGAWWPNERFPDDLGALVDELRALGCRAGLWLAPFRVQPDAPGIATDHPEWCLRRDDHAPVREPRSGSWALDASHRDALVWLRQLGAQVRAWGFEMVKIDFCYLGALDGNRHDPRITGIEALDRGFRALVDGLGDDVYVLGCGMPMLPAVGICHGNRVGHDLAMPRAHQELGHPVDDGWTGFTGVRAQARNVAARWAHAGRWYDADPEVVMAWGSAGADRAGYSIEEARVIATMIAITGGPFLLADELASLREEERAVIEDRALLDLIGHEPFRPVDLFAMADRDDVPEHAYSQGPGIPSIWQTHRAGALVLAWFNWGDAPARFPVPAACVGGTELWTGTAAGVELEVPAHAVRVLRAPSAG
jgi:alpha-galactosidase